MRTAAGLTLGLALAVVTPALAQPAVPDAATATPQAIAGALLDAGLDQQVRETLARDAAPRAAEIVTALVAGLPDSDEPEEYRRIPWIWRVAVAAGRSTDATVLQPLLDASMPRDREPLRDWQAVVLGGGIVMGLSQADRWPADEMSPWLAADAGRARRWARALTLAAAMADDAKVRNGTRYDALRMLAVVPWQSSGALLVRYLSKDVDAELQMGAIGGLADMQDERVAPALIAHMDQYTERNRALALAALLRTDARAAALRDAVARGAVQEAWLGAEQRQQLKRR